MIQMECFASFLRVSLFAVAVISMLVPQARGAQGSAANAVQISSTKDAGKLTKRQPLPFRVQSGDTLEITFPYVAEFNQSSTVQPDGSLVLRNAKSIHAEGLTLEQLTAAVRAAYGHILRNPVINVDAKALDKPSFIAAGHLAKPGKYALGSETNITEAIAIAGGFTDQSQRSQVVLFSRVDERTFQATIYDMKKLLANRDLGENGWLKPGDIVYVPQNRLSKIMRFIPSQNIGAYINPIP